MITVVLSSKQAVLIRFSHPSAGLYINFENGQAPKFPGILPHVSAFMYNYPVRHCLTAMKLCS